MPDRAMTGLARAGVFGKLPARGDFIRQGLPRGFTDPWDDWLQRGMAAAQALAGEGWVAAWLEAPVWRFALPPGVCGAAGVLGVWMPSVDRAGRYYPLTVAALAPFDWAPLLAGLAGVMDAWEQAGRDAIEHDLPPEALAARAAAALDELSAPGGETLPTAPGQARWWTQGGPRVAPRSAAGAGLPDAENFAAMVDDGWAAPRPLADCLPGAAGVP